MKKQRCSKRWLAFLLALTMVVSHAAYSVSKPLVVYGASVEETSSEAETQTGESSSASEDEAGENNNNNEGDQAAEPAGNSAEEAEGQTGSEPAEKIDEESSEDQSADSTEQQIADTAEKQVEEATDQQSTDAAKQENAETAEEPSESSTEEKEYKVTFKWDTTKGTVEVKTPEGFNREEDTVKEGTPVEFTVEAGEGYQVVSVKAGESDVPEENGAYILKGIESDTEVVVTFEETSVETDISEETSNAEESDPAEAEEIPDNEKSATEESDSVEAEEFTVTYVAMGSGKVSCTEETVKAHETANGSTATAEDGYELLGWFADEEREELLQTEETFIPEIDGDATYYAFFGPSAEVIPEVQEEEEAAVVTYEFYVDGSKLDQWTQELEDGDMLQLPDAPQKADKEFLGWFDTEGNSVSGGTVSVDETNKDKTVIVNAKYDDVFYVTFISDGKVLYTAKVSKDTDWKVSSADFNKAAENFESVAGKSLVGWKNGENDFNVSTTVESNITVSPVTKESVYVTFDSQGGSYVNKALVENRKIKTVPADPSRVGYTFQGWFTAAAGGTEVDLSSETFDEATTLYAQWEGQIVSYTVIYWEENADYDNPYLSKDKRDKDQYSYQSSKTMRGIAGEMTKASGTAPSGFKVKAIVQQEIKGDNSTIVNVYYERNEYTVTFKILECDIWWHSHGEESCYKEDKTITAKYGASISSEWPEGTYSWQIAPDNETAQANIFTMPLEGKTFYGVKKSKTETAYYYVEVLTGETGTDINGKKYKLHHRDVSAVSRGKTLNVSEEDKYNIAGYTINETISTQNGSAYNNAKFYYDRISYDIVFSNIKYGSENSYTVSKKFEEKIDGAEPSESSFSAPAGKEGYTFAGWYKDEKCVDGTEFECTGTMPAGDIRVFAKWQAPQRKITVVIDDENNKSFEVNHGDKLTVDELFEKAEIEEKDSVLGWYVKDSNGNLTEFDFNQEIKDDITIYV